eukprot:CAMPEP_0119567360 /NCGR_PEP_ID=MMETSP1352-20130426/35721_1 /TAXON_ID=265584 /ORGANISM="Stauroneis constricta, Strain CCMP1120" /LENGTH=130 /DNA_ID=CAMNT_0007616609 /DNA_START=62 /DNA_END=451 /DNA_ORIENTATION=-
MKVAGASSMLNIRVAKRRSSDSNPSTFARTDAPGTTQSGVRATGDAVGAVRAAYHPAKSADKKHDQQQQHKHGHDVDQGDGQEEIAEHFYATQVDVIKQLPGLLPYIQRHAPPTEVLKAMEPTPPISNRP